MYTQKNISSCLTITLLMLSLAGCSSGPRPLEYTEASKVEGNVSFNGEPLENGSIRFIPDMEMIGGQVAGKAIYAKIENGKYSVVPDPSQKGKGVTVGKNRVEITSMKGTGKMVAPPSGDGPKEEVMEQIIPKQFNKESTLTADVQDGENTFDFDLK